MNIWYFKVKQMGWLEGVWDGNSMLKFQHTYADFPAGKSPNADISAHMLERQHNEYYKLKNCRSFLATLVALHFTPVSK